MVLILLGLILIRGGLKEIFQNDIPSSDLFEITSDLKQPPQLVGSRYGSWY